MKRFDDHLSVSEEDIEFALRGFAPLPWLEFLLSPRKLRGSDFLMRWSQGVWSEEKVVEAVNGTAEFFAIEYGPSSTAPRDDVKAFELYFERLERAGLGDIKRPDLLIFRKNDEPKVKELINSIGDKGELPFTPEKDLKELLSQAILAIECENSLWKTEAMPNYNKPLTPQRRLGGKLGLKKGAVVPTVILKEEDIEPLTIWQENHRIEVHLWHIFFDRAFGLSFDKAKRLIVEGFIEPSKQTFQAPGGATTQKTIYKIYYHHAYHLATCLEEPSLKPAYIVDKNGHILPYVRFEGGKFKLTEEVLNILRAKR